jgi:predicted DNA-binding transcriptional regulator AlpA
MSSDVFFTDQNKRAKTLPITMSVPAAAKYAGMSTQGLYRLIKEGRLPVVRLSPHRTRFSVVELNRSFAGGAS